MANADFVVTSGILGAASVRVGLRRFLPTAPWRSRKVTDEEASAFVASLAPPTDDATRGVTAPADGHAEPTPAMPGVPDGHAEPTPTPTAGAPVVCESPADDASAPSRVLTAR